MLAIRIILLLVKVMKNVMTWRQQRCNNVTWVFGLSQAHRVRVRRRCKHTECENHCLSARINNFARTQSARANIIASTQSAEHFFPRQISLLISWCHELVAVQAISVSLTLMSTRDGLSLICFQDTQSKGKAKRGNF